MRSAIQPVILCGGAGSRLWPESRGAKAKQFLSLAADESLLAQTLKRVAYPAFDPPLIICGADHVEAVRFHAGTVRPRVLVEPMPRNTAAAIGLAVAAADPEDLLLVMPSDHVIADVSAFHAAIERAAGLASQDWLVTFGIAPDRPETGFGYIASGRPLGEAGFAVNRFIEKPPLDAAAEMVSDGGYSWNAGIFLFRAGAMRNAMMALCPAIYGAAEAALAGAEEDGDLVFVEPRHFAAAPAVSIDYAIMEKHHRVAVVPVSMGWSDLGSWQAVHGLAERDASENAWVGDVFLHDSRGCLVRSGEKRVSIVGAENLAVIVDGDDILVIPLDRSQDVRAAAKARG